MSRTTLAAAVCSALACSACGSGSSDDAETLAASHPEEETYRIIIGVLHRRIQEQCRDGVDPDGHPCAVP